MYKVEFHNKALKDLKKLKNSHLFDKAMSVVNIIEWNPYENPPPYEKMVGDLQGYIARRINIQHRLVYKVLEDKKIIRIYRMWTHYG